MAKHSFRWAIYSLILIIVAACSANKSTSIAPAIAVDSVVTINTYSDQTHSDIPANTEEKQLLTTSRGFIVEADGHVLTSYTSLLNPKNQHLAHDIRLSLLTSPETQYPAQIVAVEPTLNFAVLKINVNPALASARIIDRDHIENKKSIFALKKFSPKQPRFIKGKLKHLNAKECYQESMTSTMFEADINLTDDIIGSPIFNSSGEVLAMHTGYFPALGDSYDDDEQYLLPIFLAFNIYDSIKKRQSYISPWTGFSVRPLTETEQSVFPYQQLQGGIAIEYVWPNSPAEKLGIQVDDILVKFSYYPTPSPAEFQKWLYQHGVGAKVDLHILRKGKRLLTLPYTIEERPEWAAPK